jgi:hypothetical protein
MIPIVEPDAGQKDKRKGKTPLRNEAKISMAHAKGSKTPVDAGTIAGGPEYAGLADLSSKRRPGRIWGHVRKKRVARGKSKPPSHVTKIGSVNASLWIAPDGRYGTAWL